MPGLREHIHSRGGRVAACGLAAVGVVALGLAARQLGGGVAATSAERVFIDAHTGDAFVHTLSAGEMVPVASPHSAGAAVGYEAEPCYWTADGQLKPEPTWVLPRVKVEPSAGPTFCPDCDRLVVPLNPAGPEAPPTSREYAARSSERGRTGGAS